MDGIFCGVRASVFVSADDLKSLLVKLKEDLSLSEFRIDTDIDPPYDEFGIGEALGFGVWLNKCEEMNGYKFVLEIATEESLPEKVNNRIYDISPWFARYVSVKSGLKCAFFSSDKLIEIA